MSSSKSKTDNQKESKYIIDDLEKINFLRSHSPYALQIYCSTPNRLSPYRYSSHSPQPCFHQKSEVTLTVEPPDFHHMQTVGHDSRPDIVAWPALPNENSNLLSSFAKQTQRFYSCTTSSGSTTPIVQISNTNVKSLSPAAHSIAAAVAAVAKSSPFTSPQSSPVPHRQEYSFDFAEDTKLLNMIRAVASSNVTQTRGRESELRQKIQNLEEIVAEYERQKFNVMGTFSEYRERVAERERKLEAEYSNKIITLSEEVLGAKKDFEERMKSFQALQEQFEREKAQSLEKLREEHQKEIQLLEQRFSESQLLNLEQKYIIEIQRLEKERKSLKNEKERLNETFEIKFRRAQTMYERELSATKTIYTRELEALREHEEALKEELAARQEEFFDRLQEIQHQAKVSKDEMNNCKNEVALLEEKLRKKEMEVHDISKQLFTVRNETNEELKKLNNAKFDLEEMRKEYTKQKTDLESKSKLLTIAEITQTKLETVIRELQNEVKTLQNKVEFLEMERENLQGQSDSQTHLHNSQVQALEAVLESVTKEKETTKEHYEKLLEKEREQADEREYSIKKEFSTKLNELEDQYNALRVHIEKSDSFGFKNIRLWEEIECLRSEKCVLENEVTGLRSQLDQNQILDANEISLENIIELFKVIEGVKRKVLQRSNSAIELISQSSGSRASETNINDFVKINVQNNLSKNIDNNNKSNNNNEDFDMRQIAIDSAEPQLEADKNKEYKTFYKSSKVNLSQILEKIKNLEQSVDEIIVEKNDACVRVQQLGEENRILVEKLEHFQQLNQNRDVVDHSLLQKTLENQQIKIVELEDTLKTAKESYKLQLEKKQIQLEEKLLKQFQKENKMLKSKINQLEENLQHGESDTNLFSKMQNELYKTQDSEIKLNTELQNKVEEFESYKENIQEIIRQQKEKEILLMEQKIIKLNIEHEKTIEFIRQHEMKLMEQIEELKDINKEKVESCEDQTQTDMKNDKNFELLTTAELNKLQNTINTLKQGSEKKDVLINQLKKQLNDHCDCSDEAIQCDNESQSLIPDNINDKQWIVQEKVRKDCLQSGISEHVVMCQKASNQIHNLVAEIANKKKHSNKSVDKKLLKPKELIERTPCSSNSPPTLSSSSSTSGWSPSVTRTKSPGLTLQLCERSLSKLKYDAVAPESYLSISNNNSSIQRSILSPSEAEIRRRASLSRQFLFNKNSEKRPAWKF